MKVLYSPLVKLHVPPRGSGHAEEPRRVDKMLKVLKSLGNGFELVDPGPGRLEFFGKVHDSMYLEELKSECESALDSYFIDSDTYISPGTLYALEALAGYGRFIIEELAGGGGPILAVSRPPGHNAGVAGPGLGAPSLAGSLVNLAAAVAASLAERGFRVLIVDVGLSHGNGTQEIIQALGLEGVYMVDVHQDWRVTPPWTGEPGYTGDGRAVNINLPRGSGDDIFMAVADSIEELARGLKPDATIVSIGFDLYRKDTPFTYTNITEATYHRVGSMIAGLKAAVILEGGYREGLEKGSRAMLEAILNPEAKPPEPARSGEKAWREFEELHKDLIES
ncbi:MAG: histone deacetylase family protein [Desulfurococcales archaeon]|nr:histone deacetylase family protein [Desulfurococcales archaeon]